MAKNNDPFFFTAIECPICHNVNEFESIKTGAYTESGRDTDFCPTGRVWQNPAYQRFDPLLFFMATCKKCYYTKEFNAEYKNWQKDTAFKTYRLKSLQEKHLAEFVKEEGLVKFLGSHIDQNRYPFESAVIKFLLGIYDEKLLERPTKLDLGRWFLRIGWLFRSNKTDITAGGQATSNFLFKLKAAAVRVADAVPDYAARLRNLAHMVTNEFPLLFADRPEAEPFRKQLESAIAQIETNLPPLKAAGENLLSCFSEAEKVLVQQQSAESGFFEFPTFGDFLLKAKQLWEEVPLSEVQALAKARDYYQQAYESGEKTTAGIGQIQVAYLIAELSRRIGDYQCAREFFNQVLRAGREIVQKQKADTSTINYTKKLLEMAMEQARLSQKESEALSGQESVCPAGSRS